MFNVDANFAKMIGLTYYYKIPLSENIKDITFAK